MSRSIVWFRRDLRLSDHAALSAAGQRGEVVPVFVIDPMLIESDRVGAKRLSWLAANLRALDRSLREHGSKLIVRHGDPSSELLRLAQESQADCVFFNLDLTPFARERDRTVGLELEKHGITVETFDDVTLHHPEEITTQTGQPYQVFTAFKRAWLAKPQPSIDGSRIKPKNLQLSIELDSRPITFGSETFELPAGGEAAALDHLDRFLDSVIFNYSEARNQLDRSGTSLLSPYLRFGMLSIRQAYWGAKAAIDLASEAADRTSAEAWLNELVWREFYMSLLYHFPHTINQPLRAQFKNFEWLDDTAAFEAWCAGRTGYPVVDAALRCLNQTGWLHNRARMIVASFLTKDLLIDWRQGERYFMRQLIDGDTASNVGGWQWASGVGADAQPFFRVFNPTLQGKRFDPHGDFVRRWLPELARVPIELIHEPWKMNAMEQSQAGCVIDRDYPSPIIDHRLARDRALQHYRGSKTTA